MHKCEEFRELITEHIVDREDLASKAKFQRELLICTSCSEFYAESREMIEALSSVELGISELQWNGIEHRLRERISSENVSAAVNDRWSYRIIQGRARANPRPLQWKQLLAAAALLLVTVGLSRMLMPTSRVHQLAESAPQTMYVQDAVPLDPVTVDFLEQSELLLRDVMKITPADADDLADAKKTASEQLARINLRKLAAAEVPPVVDVMETYETVLRDLRNVDDRNAADDIPDIQKRIQKNALIASMKAFQPSVTPVSFRLP
jgi:hypothetical protein